MYAVRAYPEGEAYGNPAYILPPEVGKQLPKRSERLPEATPLIGFVDTGRATLDFPLFSRHPVSMIQAWKGCHEFAEIPPRNLKKKRFGR
jgi:hemolysin activation/secretion protein